MTLTLIDMTLAWSGHFRSFLYTANIFIKKAIQKLVFLSHTTTIYDIYDETLAVRIRQINQQRSV